MADWYGTSRSNYFRVKDKDAFLKFVNATGVESYIDDKNRYAVAAGDDGFWPAGIYKRYEDGTDECEDIDFVDELASHLADGEVAVLMTAGAEKLRYVTGCAVAVKNDGSSVSVNIDDIYDLAFLKWGVQPSHAEY